MIRKPGSEQGIRRAPAIRKQGREGLQIRCAPEEVRSKQRGKLFAARRTCGTNSARPEELRSKQQHVAGVLHTDADGRQKKVSAGLQGLGTEVFGPSPVIVIPGLGAANGRWEKGRTA